MTDLAALTLLQQSGPNGQAALAMHNASGGSMHNQSRALSSTTMPVRNAPTFVEPRNTMRNEIIKEEPIRATDVPAGSSSTFTPASSAKPGRPTEPTETRMPEPANQRIACCRARRERTFNQGLRARPHADHPRPRRA